MLAGDFFLQKIRYLKIEGLPQIVLMILFFVKK